MSADQWVTLPEYPTTAMFFAATDERVKKGESIAFGVFLKEYRAMLCAAPSARCRENKHEGKS